MESDVLSFWPPSGHGGGVVPNTKGHRAGFGSVRFRPSRKVGAKRRDGRWQARYTGPDGRLHVARSAGGSASFETKGDAEAALAAVRTSIDAGTWTPPDAPAPVEAEVVTLRAYATTWLAQRDVEVRTREHYDQILRDHILPALGDRPLTEITAAHVDTWHAALDPKKPTARAHAYGLLRTIMAAAVDRDLIVKSPCRIRGAGQTKRAREIRPASLAELEAVVKALPERYRLVALLAAWCALRFGELAELRRSDVELRTVKGVEVGLLRISRGVVRTKDQGRVVKGPKSEAGRRTVAIPPHLLPLVREHLRQNVNGRDGLLFPAANDPTAHMQHSTLNKVWLKARETAGRPDLAFHDLRHTGAVLAAATGATLAELMARLGHSTPGAAMRYQHAAADRDRAIADALSGLAAAATVTPITAAPVRAKRKPQKRAQH